MSEGERGVAPAVAPAVAAGNLKGMSTSTSAAVAPTGSGGAVQREGSGSGDADVDARGRGEPHGDVEAQPQPQVQPGVLYSLVNVGNLNAGSVSVLTSTNASSNGNGNGDGNGNGLQAQAFQESGLVEETEDFRSVATADLEAGWRDAWARREAEERRRREEDLEYRRERKRRYEVEMVQRAGEDRRRRIDEKNEQLKSIITVAALIAGFEVVVLVDLQWEAPVPEWLLALYTATSALTVCLMTYSYVVCSLVMVAIIKRFEGSVDAFFTLQGSALNSALALERTRFEVFWENTCEEDWHRAFRCFSIGMPIFLLNLIVVSWVKFYDLTAPGSVVAVLCGLTIFLLLSTHLKWGTFLLRRKSIVASKPVAPTTSASSPHAPAWGGGGSSS